MRRMLFIPAIDVNREGAGLSDVWGIETRWLRFFFQVLFSGQMKCFQLHVELFTNCSIALLPPRLACDSAAI